MTKPDTSDRYRDLAGSIPILRDAYIDGASVPAISGATFVNLNPSMGAPLRSYRRSGSLAGDNGTEAMEQYLQTKTIWINVRA